jgi:hypothetical protein
MNDPEFSCSLQTARENPQEQKTRRRRRRRRSRSFLNSLQVFRAIKQGTIMNPGNKNKTTKKKHQL